MVTEVTDKGEFDKLANGDTPLLVNFGACWCGPCQMIAPLYKELAASAEHKGLRFIKVDVDEADDIVEATDVQSLPTFQVYKHGKVVESWTGGNAEKLRACCEKFCSGASADGAGAEDTEPLPKKARVDQKEEENEEAGKAKEAPPASVADA
mmetsp:Transcript_37288/g.95401  ORF Transcript_37288/g.95401 Transcript_37288/m.95401 type:complete len:152 (+) Transcript_37288:3-458(+)